MSEGAGGKGKPRPKASSAPDTIHIAARKGNLAACRRMLENKPSLVEEMSEATGKTPLHYAAQVGRYSYLILSTSSLILDPADAMTVPV
jgi:ankyrin repeat protein